MNFGFKEKIIAGAVGIILIIAGWYFFFYSSMSNEIELMQAEIGQLTADIQQAMTDSTLLETLQGQIEDLKKENAKNQNLIVPLDSSVYVTDELTARCAQYNLELTQPPNPDLDAIFGESADSSATGIKMVGIDLYLEGTFFDLGRFIESFPEFPFLIKAGSVEIDTDDTMYPLLSATLKTYVFFRSKKD
ncbi:hypothetical protein ACFL67_03660 [candidate division KSB1 bacterium]